MAQRSVVMAAVPTNGSNIRPQRKAAGWLAIRKIPSVGVRLWSDMGIPQSFEGIWWSVEVPPGWRACGDEECATFQGTPPIGAFQINSAQKEASPITDANLEEFAFGRIPEGARLVHVVHGRFSGFTASFEKDDLISREWWLRAGGLMVYATYNVAAHSLHAAVKEQADVECMLATLKLKGNAG